MNNDVDGNGHNPQSEEAVRRRDLRRALAFGVVMATIQMAVLLFFVFC